MQKLYCYVDETGQDTEGKFFLVAVVIVDAVAHEQLRQRLLEIERNVGKKRARWAQNRPKVRIAYLERILSLKELTQSIFYASYHDRKDYIPLTADTIIKAVQHRISGAYRATIEIDGFNEAELAQVRQLLKAGRIHYHKLRGPRDESAVFIRLADAFAGFLRDSQEGHSAVQNFLARFKRKGLIGELS
jgi:hypothetical protein